MKNTSNKPGKGSGRRPRTVSYKEFSSRWDGINGFGDRTHLHGVPDEPQVKVPKNKKKSKTSEMCPHCATNNLVKESDFVSVCSNCGYKT